MLFANSYTTIRCALGLIVGSVLIVSLPQKAIGQERQSYIYKARNLQPEDFNIDARSWSMAIRRSKDGLNANPNSTTLLMQRAIAYREYGVRRALLLRKIDWNRSRKDFEAVLSRDSSYQDVLYQYATLARYDGEFENAFYLLQRQIALKPELPHPYVALFRLYQQFLLDKDKEDVQEWLASHNSPFLEFWMAERKRKLGQLRTADSDLAAMLKKAQIMPIQPVLLSRARIYYAMGLSKIAQSFVMQAINVIDSETDAWLVMEDFKYILNDNEIRRFFILETPEAYRDFFINALEQRNPVRSQEVNRRLTEHYRRLLESEKIYAFYESREAYRVGNNVSKNRMADNEFPMAYWLNGEYGDKGLIYIRHGDPNDKIASVSEDTPPIESWRYYSPDLDFHFEGHSGFAELIPTLPLVLDALEPREIWGGIYARLASTARRAELSPSEGTRAQTELDFISFEGELFDETRGAVYDGLSTDRHQWSKDMKVLPVPHFTAAFQGEEDSTTVEIYFSVPIGVVSRALAGRSRVEIEVGLAVHDSEWNEVFTTLETLKVDASRAQDAVAVDFIRFEAKPDVYHINFHAQIVDTEWLGAYQFDYEVPAYVEPALLISDIVPAFEVSPIDRPSRYAKKGLYVRSNPGRGFDRDNPFYFYFEIYNLTFGDQDLTDYEITYTLQKPGSDGRRRLFNRGGRKDPVISISYDRSGSAANLAEYGEIDMSAVSPGAYELVVTILDNNTNLSVSNTQVIELGK